MEKKTDALWMKGREKY